MKKTLISFLILYINVYKISNVNTVNDLLIVLLMLFLSFIFISVLWNNSLFHKLRKYIQEKLTCYYKTILK